MTGSHLFNLGLFQKNFNSTSRVTGPAINMGCTKGRGSTTRMFNYCKQYSPAPSLCINQFITTNNRNLTKNMSVHSTNKQFNKNIDITIYTINEEDTINEDTINEYTINKDINEDTINEDEEYTINEEDTINEDEEDTVIESTNYDNILPELTEIYFLKKKDSEEWFDNNDV